MTEGGKITKIEMCIGRKVVTSQSAGWCQWNRVRGEISYFKLQFMNVEDGVVQKPIKLIENSIG